MSDACETQMQNASDDDIRHILATVRPVAIGTRVIWMQWGVAHNASTGKARNASLQVVTNRDIMVEHRNTGIIRRARG